MRPYSLASTNPSWFIRTLRTLITGMWHAFYIPELLSSMLNLNMSCRSAPGVVAAVEQALSKYLTNKVTVVGHSGGGFRHYHYLFLSSLTFPFPAFRRCRDRAAGRGLLASPSVLERHRALHRIRFTPGKNHLLQSYPWPSRTRATYSNLPISSGRKPSIRELRRCPGPVRHAHQQQTGPHSSPSRHGVF